MAIKIGNLGYTVEQIIEKFRRINVGSNGNTKIGYDGHADIDIYGTIHFYDEQDENRCSLDASTLWDLQHKYATKIHYGTANPNDANPSGSSNGDIYVRYSTPT